MIVYIPGVAISAGVTERFGLRTTVLIGAALNFIGAGVRAIGSQPSLYWVTLVGQTICAFGQCFVLSIPGNV